MTSPRQDEAARLLREGPDAALREIAPMMPPLDDGTCCGDAHDSQGRRPDQVAFSGDVVAWCAVGFVVLGALAFAVVKIVEACRG